jgi:hypothetical protein
MPDIIPGGPPSSQWRDEGPVRDFEPREASGIVVARDIEKFGAEWSGSLSVSVLSAVASLSLVRNGVGRGGSVGNLFFRRWVFVLGF